METILFITQLASCITAVVAVLTLLIKPIREKILKTDKESEGEKCLLRSEMLKIYYKHVDEQTIRQYELENFIKLYEAYRSLGGNSIKKAVLEDTKNILEEIRELSIEQSKNLEKLNQSSKDVLRQKIMTIYHQYKEYRKMPIFAKEALDELYKDYKSQGGNNYIDKYYNRMSNWEIDYTEDEENL